MWPIATILASGKHVAPASTFLIAIIYPKSVSWAVAATDFCGRSTVTGSSGLQLSRRHEFPSAQKFFQRLAENSIPPFECRQLLRSLAQVREKAGDADEGGAGARMLAVARGDGDGGGGQHGWSVGRSPGAARAGW